MTTLLVCLLILAVIIIFVICFEFRSYKEKIEKDEKADNQIHKDEVKQGNDTFLKCKNRIDGLTRIIEPKSNLLSVYDFREYHKDYHMQNFSLATDYLDRLAQICELATHKINKLEEDVKKEKLKNRICMLEIDAYRLQKRVMDYRDGQKNLDMIERIVACDLRDVGQDLFKTYEGVVSDIKDHIEIQENLKNDAIVILKDIDKALKYLDSVSPSDIKDKSEVSWTGFLASAPEILLRVKLKMKENIDNQYFLEANKIGWSVEGLLNQIDFLKNNLVSPSEIASSAVGGGGLVL